MFQKYILYISTLIFCTFDSSFSLDPLPKEVTKYLATREMRHHHTLWHTIRNAWNRLDPDVQKDIRKLGWAPPRPSRGYDEDGNSYAMEDNHSGEDFFYMHRQMIATANSIAEKACSDWRVVGWEKIPEPGDLEYPVPPDYNASSESTTAQINEMKTDEYFEENVRPLERRFTDPDYLRSITLGELGSRIEFTIHAIMHHRWSQKSCMGYRTRPSNPMPYIDPMWDEEKYIWLPDVYGGHVNPVFWKIHGWVDNRIEDWKKANNVEEIEWKGTWTGGDMNMVDELVEVGEEHDLRVSAVEIAPPGQEHNLRVSDVQIPGTGTGASSSVNVTTTSEIPTSGGSDSGSVTTASEMMEQVMQILMNAGVEFSFVTNTICSECKDRRRV